MHYKGFDIKTIEDEPGKLKAAIRRAGGGTLRPARPATGPDVPAVTTHLFSRREDAVTEAKRVIDGGGVI